MQVNRLAHSVSGCLKFTFPRHYLTVQLLVDKNVSPLALYAEQAVSVLCKHRAQREERTQQITGPGATRCESGGSEVAEDTERVTVWKVIIWVWNN